MLLAGGSPNGEEDSILGGGELAWGWASSSLWTSQSPSLRYWGRENEPQPHSQDAVELCEERSVPSMGTKASLKQLSQHPNQAKMGWEGSPRSIQDPIPTVPKGQECPSPPLVI